MPTKTIEIGVPFFSIHHIADEPQYQIIGKSILLNLGSRSIAIENQRLGKFQSVVVANTQLHDLQEAVVIEGFDTHADEAALFARVRQHWQLAYDVRGEERLRGVEHYLSPRDTVGNIRFSMYHSGTVPLKVGLHQQHPVCSQPGFREIHTQIVGFGKMQQCREKDLQTLYLEEPMAPGNTHKPMYDEAGNYPWHQYETITPGIFMATEIFPAGADIPA